MGTLVELNVFQMIWHFFKHKMLEQLDPWKKEKKTGPRLNIKTVLSTYGFPC